MYFCIYVAVLMPERRMSACEGGELAAWIALASGQSISSRPAVLGSVFGCSYQRFGSCAPGLFFEAKSFGEFVWRAAAGSVSRMVNNFASGR